MTGNEPKRGRARSAVTTRAYAGVHCKEAIEYFVAVMRNDKETTRERSAAAKIILEYGAGKPAVMDADGEVVKDTVIQVVMPKYGEPESG